MLLILVLGASALTALGAPADAKKSENLLIEEQVRVPRNQFRAVRIPLRQRPATILCQFETTDGGRVRATVMTEEELGKRQEGKSYRVQAATEPGHEGKIAYAASRRGDYVVLLENETEPARAAQTRVRIALEYDPANASFEPRVLPAETQRRIVAVSFGGFSVAAGLCAWRIAAAVRRRPHGDGEPEFPAWN